MANAHFNRRQTAGYIIGLQPRFDKIYLELPLPVVIIIATGDVLVATYHRRSIWGHTDHTNHRGSQDVCCSLRVTIKNSSIRSFLTIVGCTLTIVWHPPQICNSGAFSGTGMGGIHSQSKSSSGSKMERKDTLFDPSSCTFFLAASVL